MKIVRIALMLIVPSYIYADQPPAMARIYALLPQAQSYSSQVKALSVSYDNAVRSKDYTATKRAIALLLPAYEQLLLAYKGLYANAAVLLDVRIQSPMTNMLKRLYATLLQDTKLHINIMKSVQTDPVKYVNELNSLLTILDNYDGYVQHLTTTLYGSKADASRALYATMEVPLVVPALQSSLSLIRIQFDKIPNALLLAQQVYDHVQQYIATQGKTLPSNLALVQRRATQAMDDMYDKGAQQVLKGIDFQKNTQDKNIHIFNDVASMYQKMIRGARSIKDTKKDLYAQQQVKIIKNKVAVYQQVKNDYARVLKLATRTDLKSLQQAQSLIAQVITSYQQLGDTISQNNVSHGLDILNGNVSLLQARDALTQYKKAAQAYSNAHPIQVSGVQAVLVPAEYMSGINIQGSDLIDAAGKAYAAAFDSYTKAAQALVPQQTIVPLVSLEDAKYLSTIIPALQQAQDARLKGDQAARQLSLQALQQALQSYNAARDGYAQIDAAFSTARGTYMPLFPTLILNDPHVTYVQVFNNYLGHFFIDICKSILTTSPSLVLNYYASVASRGVDMQSAINQIITGIDFLTSARQSIDQARSITADPQNWVAQTGVQGYVSMADTAWQTGMSLYETGIKNGRADIVSEYVSVVAEYATARLNHMPQANYPLLGALLVYYGSYSQLSSTADQPTLTTLQNGINTYKQQITALVKQLNDQVDSLVSQQQYAQAVDAQGLVVMYDEQQYPNTQQRILDTTDDDLRAVLSKSLNLLYQWGGNLLVQKNYAQAYTTLSQALLGYQQASSSVPENVRQAYFLAKTLATAQALVDSVYTKDQYTVGTFTVPATYYLKEYLQLIPPAVPTTLNPQDLVRYVYIINKLTDLGIDFTQVYNPTTFARLSGISKDTTNVLDQIESEAQQYVSVLTSNKDYSAEVVSQGQTWLLKEHNKLIPIVDGPYSTAPTAIGYYYSALLLFRPGTSLVTLQNQTFVPGQDDDSAWNMAHAMSYAFLSDSVRYSQTMQKISSTQDFKSFQQAQDKSTQIYNRLDAAQEYLNGKDHSDNFQGVSKFADEANYLNSLISQMLGNNAQTLGAFIQGDETVDNLKSIVTEVDKNYTLARQYLIDYQKTQGVTDPYAISAANDFIVSDAQMYKSSGQINVKNKQYFKAVPYYSAAAYKYQDLVDHNITQYDAVTQRDALNVSLYTAYFYGSADSVDQYYSIITQHNVVGYYAYTELVTKKNEADQSTSADQLTQEEFDTYNHIEGLILDALMYYLLASDKFSGAGTTDTSAQKNIDSYINQYIQSLNFDLSRLNDNQKFQQTAVKGFEYLQQAPNAPAKYALLGAWSMQMYLSLQQTYIKYYLPNLDADTQQSELKSRIDARLQQVSLSN